jgi:hypothetical protein
VTLLGGARDRTPTLMFNVRGREPRAVAAAWPSGRSPSGTATTTPGSWSAISGWRRTAPSAPASCTTTSARTRTASSKRSAPSRSRYGTLRQQPAVVAAEVRAGHVDLVDVDAPDQVGRVDDVGLLAGDRSALVALRDPVGVPHLGGAAGRVAVLTQVARVADVDQPQALLVVALGDYPALVVVEPVGGAEAADGRREAVTERDGVDQVERLDRPLVRSEVRVAGAIGRAVHVRDLPRLEGARALAGQLIAVVEVVLLGDEQHVAVAHARRAAGLELRRVRRIELWWMKSFHGVEVPWAFVPLTTLGASGSETSKAAEPPEPVCQPMPAESKSQ